MPWFHEGDLKRGQSSGMNKFSKCTELSLRAYLSCLCKRHTFQYLEYY